MFMLDVTSFKVGDTAVLMSSGGLNRGTYVCTKINKVRIEMSRVGDDYKKYFSVKTGKELGTYADKYTYFVSVAEAERILESQRQAGELRRAFALVESAAASRNMERLTAAYNDLVELLKD